MSPRCKPCEEKAAASIVGEVCATLTESGLDCSDITERVKRGEIAASDYASLVEAKLPAGDQRGVVLSELGRVLAERAQGA